MLSLNKLALVLVTVVLLGLLPGALLKAAFPGVVLPNFLIIILFYLALYEEGVLGVVFAFLMGLLSDIISGLLLGPWATSFVCTYIALLYLASKMHRHSLLVIFILVFVACIIASGFFTAIVGLTESNIILSADLIGMILLEALFTSVASLAVVPLLCRILAFQRSCVGSSITKWSGSRDEHF